MADLIGLLDDEFALLGSTYCGDGWEREEEPTETTDVPVAWKGGFSLDGWIQQARHDAVVKCHNPRHTLFATAGTLPSLQALEMAIMRDGPIRNFTVLMPCLMTREIDFETLPQQIKVALGFLRSFSPRDVMPDHVVASLPVFLPPQREEHRGRKTLLLDLDETLVHCYPSALVGAPPPGLELQIYVSSPPMHAHVYIRPFTDFFLSLVGRDFEVVIFTASAAIYADQVLDFLDPDHTIISHRLYRQHCTEIRGGHFKDLRRLGRPIEDVMLVDNSPLALGLCPDNGIPIASWFGMDYDDVELQDLLSVIYPLRATASIPACLSRRYGLGGFLDFQRAQLAARPAE